MKLNRFEPSMHSHTENRLDRILVNAVLAVVWTLGNPFGDDQLFD